MDKLKKANDYIETLEQRESGVTLDWIRLQIKSDLAGVADRKSVV